MYYYTVGDSKVYFYLTSVILYLNGLIPMLGCSDVISCEGVSCSKCGVGRKIFTSEDLDNRFVIAILED